MAFFNASIVPGIQIITDAAKLRQRLEHADLCITGEGQFDHQSLSGKTTIGVARLCKEMNIPCIVLAGTLGHGTAAAYAEGTTSHFSIAPGPISLEDSITQAPELLAAAAENVCRLFATRRA